jgi:tetratricopeptide (TPR) repeat protein
MSETLGQCDISLTRYYEWNGSWFDLKNVSLDRWEGGFSSLKDCYGYISHFSDKDTVLEKVQILDEAIRVYSPGSDNEKDILEEFRVKKGLAYLFSGNPDKAREVFEEIVNNPFKQDGIWVTPVKNFLKVYQAPSDLYRACAALTACDPNRPQMIEDPKHRNCVTINPCQIQALQYVLSSQSLLQPLKNFTSSLRTAGVKIASEGLVDLDNDARDELWFMVEPPTQMYYELWLVSDYPNGIQMFAAGAYPNAISEPTLKPIISNRTLIDLGQPTKLIWTRNPDTHIPSLKSLYESEDPNDTTDYAAINIDLKEFEKLQSQLYSSKNYMDIYEKLLAIAQSYDACPYLLNSPMSTFYEYECGNYYYTIGFAAELANDNNMAKKMYETVLEQYPTNPIALLAKKKLD